MLALASLAGPASAGATVPVPAAAAVPAGGSATDGSAADGGAAGAGAVAQDPLARNGFGSPLCRDPRLRSQLDASVQDNCRSSSFAAGAEPTGNYAFDVHIDTGLLPDEDTVSMLVQDLLLTPVWTALVWIAHALVVALEWCYSVDLLDGTTLGSVAGALRAAHATFTQPWMAAALALASVLALYEGVVRRRVADTLAEFALMLAMMAVGLWIILDPAATVGSLSRFAVESSLGTVGAISRGTPDRPAQSLAAGMGDLFATAVGAPWCYLEFGDVDWCREPARLDPRLRAAADRIAAARAPGPATELLRRARTNGDLFLALPANGPERNSINEPASLLHVLCGTSDATRCRGPTAAQAEWRTAGGTWPRAGGLLLIAIGAAGMIALLAFIGLRLLGAAVASLLYLLLAPAAVLAPALGEAGRNAFRGWGARLIGAVLAKLLYSVFLGVVLLVLHVLDGLGQLGWWTQWILVAVLWWTAWGHRHEVLRFATLGHRETGARGMRVASALMVSRELSRLGRRGPLPRPAPDPTHGPPPPPPPPPPPDPGRDSQLVRTLEHERRDRAELQARALAVRRRLPANRERLDRLRRERAAAERAGDRRRSAQLGVRAGRVAQEVATDERLLRSAAPLQRRRPAITASWLDEQARRPSSREQSRGRPRRDYAALAGLAGMTPTAYRELDPQAQRAARLAIDRELDHRHAELEARATGPRPVPRPGPSQGERRPPPRPDPSPGPRRSASGPPESVVLRRERQFAGWRAARQPSPPESGTARD